MVEIVELDKEVAFAEQLEAKEGPVISMNVHHVKPELMEPFLAAWAADGEIMRRQPGFISAQLYRGIAGSGVLIHYTVWESTENLKHAYNNPEFQTVLKQYPSGITASPHVFKPIAVPGICVAF